MHQNPCYSTGWTGLPEIPVMTPTAVTLIMRIKPKNSDSKVEFTCLSPGGMIKATVPEKMHGAAVDPEPGVGYGGYGKTRDSWKSGPGKIFRLTSGKDHGYRGILCS